MEADISSQAVGLASAADFSILKLFIRADIIVKSVIILLIAASIYITSSVHGVGYRQIIQTINLNGNNLGS